MRARPVLVLLSSVLLAAVPLLGAGCGRAGDRVGSGDGNGNGSDAPGPGGEPGALDGRTFVLASATVDGAGRPLVAGTEIRLTFTGDTLGAHAGCNHLGGQWSLDGDVLRVAEMSTTDMGCDPERHAQDEWLASVLTAGPTVATAGDDLTVTAGTTVLALVDRRVASPDRPLVGTAWVLDTLLDGAAASSVPGGVEAGITFAADGTFTLDAGCNRGGGRVRVEAGTVHVLEQEMQLVGCPDDRATVEEHVLAVLDGAVAYEITEARLTLTRGDRGLGFRADD